MVPYNGYKCDLVGGLYRVFIVSLDTDGLNLTFYFSILEHSRFHRRLVLRYNDEARVGGQTW